MPRFMESEGLFRGLILPILMLMLMNHFDYIQDIKWLIYEFKGPLSAHFLPKNIFKDFFEQNFINYTDSSELVDFDCFPANWALHIEGHVPFFNVQTVVDTCDVRNSLNKLLGMANDFLVEDLSRDLERNEWWSLTSFVNRLVQSEQPEYSKLRYLYQIGLDEEHTIIELNNLNEAVKIIEIPVEGSNQDIRAYWTIPKGCVENYKNAPTVLYLDGLDGDLWRTFKTISMFRNDLRVNSIALIPRGLGKNSPHMIVTKKSIITDVHAVMKYIIEQWKMGLTSKIIIYGHQLGSALALQLTSEYPNFVAGIILENPTSNLRPKDYKDTRISREIEFKSIIDQVSTVLDSTKEWDTTHMIPLIAFRADHQPQFAVIPNNQHDDLNPFENLTFIFDTLGIKASILNISTSKNEESGYHINGLEKFIAGLESKITCIDKD